MKKKYFLKNDCKCFSFDFPRNLFSLMKYVVWWWTQTFRYVQKPCIISKICIPWDIHTPYHDPLILKRTTLKKEEYRFYSTKTTNCNFKWERYWGEKELRESISRNTLALKSWFWNPYNSFVTKSLSGTFSNMYRWKFMKCKCWIYLIPHIAIFFNIF